MMSGQQVSSAASKDVAWIDGVAIFFAVLVVCLVTTINDYQKERQFQKLTETADAEKTVCTFAHL